jgi:hypothetical protein
MVFVCDVPLTWISRTYVSTRHVCVLPTCLCMQNQGVRAAFCWKAYPSELINRYLCWHVMFLRVYCCSLRKSSTYSGHRSQPCWCSSSTETPCWAVWPCWRSCCLLPTFSPRQQQAGFFNTRWFIYALQFVHLPFHSLHLYLSVALLLYLLVCLGGGGAYLCLTIRLAIGCVWQSLQKKAAVSVWLPVYVYVLVSSFHLSFFERVHVFSIRRGLQLLVYEALRGLHASK